MEQLITGIHHVTAVASNAQENIDFYVGILGLRLVKKTVNSVFISLLMTNDRVTSTHT